MKKHFRWHDLVFIFVALYLLAVLIDQQGTLKRSIEENRALKEDISVCQEEMAQLEEEESIVETDEYIEKKARELLGYVKNNETVYITD